MTEISPGRQGTNEPACARADFDLPTVEMCLSFLAEENVPNNVIDHCMAVENLALKIAKRITDDEETLALVSRAALLHDIGRSKTHGLDHAIVGAEILRKRGVDERICLIVERHLGAGIPASEAAALGLPERDLVPETLAEKIVCHADNLLDEQNHRTVRRTLAQEMEEARGKGLDSMAERMLKMHRELGELAGIDIDEIQ